MKRLLPMFAIALAALACLPAGAQAAFGLNNFEVTFSEADGTPAEAGAHPFAATTRLGANLDDSELIPEGWLRDIVAGLPAGFVGDTTAYPPCTTAQFLTKLGKSLNLGEPACPLETQVGVIGAAIGTEEGVNWTVWPVYNVTPPPGVLLRIGFRIASENVFVDAGLSQSPPYNAIGASRNTPQIIHVFGSAIQLWGNPSDPRHDELRGECGHQETPFDPHDIAGFQFLATGRTFCQVGDNPKPFLTMPTNCSEPLLSTYEALSWNDRDGDGRPDSDAGSALTPALRGCGKLGFHPSITAKPTSRAAGSPTGLDFTLDVEDEGLTNAEEGARSQSTIRKVVATLPEGMTINPSQAEGLEVCSEADLERETVSSPPGAGCPEASKIGTVEVESPLAQEAVKGALFVATPHENLAGDSLIAVYLVIKNANLGVIVKQALRVEPDPRTGQLITTTAGDVPQVPFSHFRLHFREGGRSPLVTPPLCGAYEANAEMTPWSGGAPLATTASFQVVSGPNESPCPAGGTPPFEPGFDAGSQSNAAGRHSPFSMRLTRRDGDQDLTRFDATLPPGVGAILAGVDKCPDAQIALAKAKSGLAELASPSCPLNSRIGGVIGGAGVGSQLTYVRGSIYLAGALGGAPLSVVAIVPAVAGPFDVGTVVTRQALRINPRTGQATVDGAVSDPIPHILAGIPLVVRDIQVHVDRSRFTYNPTSCDPFATKASIWGGGANPFSSLDDSPVARKARFQAASCQSLGFKPRLNLKLKGGTRRGAFPALRLLYRPRQGDANLSSLSLRFPRSEFIEQGHFRTICTRVQFAAGAGNGAQCPKDAVYGKVRVFTPILPEPLTGPVYLRSSNHKLPDVVLALHGPPSLPIDFEVVSKIDSIKGGLRAIAEELPDAPVSKVILNMQGGQKGLFVNSTNICRGQHRAKVSFTAQSAKQLTTQPPLQPSCAKQRTHRRAPR
jgi:hypothetical protein